MTALTCYLCAAFFLFCMRLVKGIWPWGYLCGGLYYGIYNEICFEFCWNYRPELGPMLWRDVPLIIVIGWSAYTAMSLSLTDLIADKTGLNNPLLVKTSDVLLFFVIGYPLERLMSKLNLWDYHNTLQAAFWIQISGYLFAGILVSATGRQLQTFFKTNHQLSSLINK